MRVKLNLVPELRSAVKQSTNGGGDTVGPTDSLLVVEGLCAGYGTADVLSDVSLHVNSGEIVALIGANGAGKSTLLRAISRMISSRAKRLVFRGASLTNCATHQLVGLGLAHVPEGRQIFSRMTVQENLLLGAYTKSGDATKGAAWESVISLFPVLGERLAQLGGTLSGGEQQMLAIGRALMSEPTLLLLDEPSMGVAPLLVERIFATIKTLNARGVTVLLVEQNAGLALEIANRGYVLESGRIATSGTGTALREDPIVRAAYLGG